MPKSCLRKFYIYSWVMFNQEYKVYYSLFFNNRIFCVFNTKLYFLGKLKNRKWESAFTIDKKSWGFRKNAVLSDFMSMEEILHQVITTVR